MNSKRIASLLVLLAGLAGASFGQTALTQTTLASAVNGPALYSGTTSSLSLTVTLASCTGLAAPILPGTPSSIIYVDREAMGVFAVNTSSCVLTVNRGYLGTQASPHLSGQMVLYGPNYAVTLAQGGNPLPNGFFQQDAPLGASCTPTNTPTTPWLNVLTGAQWLCSSLTNSWVAGWNNPYATEWSGATANVASAAGAITPSGPTFTITGSAAVTGFNIPVGFDATAVGYGCFNIIGGAGNTATWTAAGNIAIAGTFTPNKLFSFCWNAGTQKFYPSATA